MKKASISIVTTVKNGEPYISETLQSIKVQTFKNFEHIVVDDGSTDNTVEIIKEFQDKNPSYKLRLFQPGSLGRGKALNYGVGKAKGEWIAIIDADDIWHPEKLEHQINCFYRNPNIDVLGTKTRLFGVSKELLPFSTVEKKEKVTIISKQQLLKNCCLSHSSVLIRKKYCEYDEKRNSQLDYELWLRLNEEGGVLANLDSVLNYHRVHKDQSFESKQGKKYRLKGFKLVLPYILKNNAYNILVVKTIKLLFSYVLPGFVLRKIRKKRN